MNIELLDEKRVLIDLCVEDMQMLSLEYKALSMQSPNNRKIIKNLVQIAKIKTGFHTDEGSVVFVEAMPYDGGCFILITLKENELKGKRFRVLKKPYKKIFCFDSCENMLCAIEKLYLNNLKNYKSILIFYKDSYYLLISSKNNVKSAVNIVVSEFSNHSSSNIIYITHIIEHGKVLSENNAIETIGKAMNK